MSNQLITFFGVGEDGISKLVGVGLTDDMINHLKRAGGVLEDSKRTGMDTDVVLFYAPTVNELMEKIKSSLPEGSMKIKMV